MCKCRASSYEEHVKVVSLGYPGHTYKGTIWFFGKEDA